MKSISAGLAGAVLLSIAGLAGAATQLVLPLDERPRFVKSFAELPMQFNRAGLENLKSGAEIELTLPNGSRHGYLFEEAIDHGGGFKTWIARSPLAGANERAIITSGPGGAWGWMKTTYGDYRIYPSGKGYDLVVRRDRINFAPKAGGSDAVHVGPDDPSVEPFKGIPTVLAQPLSKSIFAKVTPAPLVQSDVMILYTQDLAQKLGVGLMPMILNVIATTNTAYADSEVAITLRLVNATMIDWPNANASGATLSGMAGGGAHAAFFQNLTWGGASSLRNMVGADFVALLRDGPDDTGGIGNLPKNPVIYPVSTVTSSAGYSVNNFCASGCEGIFAHELGHNMGNHHDPATIAFDNNGAVSETGVFSFSYGYYSCATALTCNPFVPGTACTSYAECAGNDANDFGTIMSYLSPKIMKFSNPLLANCAPAGAPGPARACGGAVPAPAPATVSNNALSMNNVRGALSAYRNQTLTNLAGNLQFTAVSYSGAEGSTVTFTVSRANGSSGSASVNYVVTAGTATAGTDYTAANGTLNWAAGETANKTFNVTLTADALVEGVETFTVTLSTPTGAPGVYIGYPNVATGLIVEPWPIGTLGGLPTDPTGWTTPASPASSVPWSIVNEVGGAPVGDPGGNSLKSGLLNFAIKNCTEGATPVPCPSAVQITRNFSAGTVAFSYRVSALVFFGMMEFLVDGVVVHSAQGDPANAANGGDTGWRFFSTNISAGSHTLQWRYRTRLGFGCNGVSVGGVSYPGCQDRAWIDQLALPADQVAPPNPPRMSNISTRMQVLTGDNVMIAGFVIGGSTNKDVAVVATGPSLAAFGITNPLANPTMTLVRSSDQSVVATNDNWGSAANAAALQAAGFAPTNSLEAGLLVNLAPGAYTAIVQGVGGGTGVAVAAVYEVSGPEIPLTNISTRGRVGAGADVMIGGFVIQGTGPQQVAIVATGPSLAAFGIASPLANPTLTLVRSSDQVAIANNDDWQLAANSAALQAAGFAPTHPREAAILTTLQPGAYTAIVQGVGGGVGVAVVGVYRVP